MPLGSKVRPQKWSGVIDLYDDGYYSAIWGCYEKGSDKCLGVRWNGGESHGYPNQGNNPLWYIEPSFMVKNVLLELLDRVNMDASRGDIESILNALKEHGA